MITHCVVTNQRTIYSAGWTGKGRYMYVYQILKSFKKIQVPHFRRGTHVSDLHCVPVWPNRQIGLAKFVMPFWVESTLWGTNLVPVQ